MLDFYKKVMISIALLTLASVALVYWGFERTLLQHSLLPAEQSQYLWQAFGETDEYIGGESQITLRESSYALEYEALILPKAQYPSASLSMEFIDEQGQQALVDFSRYQRLTFRIKCSPNNVLALLLFTFDDQVSEAGNYLTYRSPVSYIACDGGWGEGSIDLTRMEVPQWWLESFDLKLSMNEYSLAKVAKLMFGSTFQSPQQEPFTVRINHLALQGRDWRFAYGVVALLVLVWLLAAAGLFRAYTQALTRELKSKFRRDRPLVAYQQLSVQPQQDKSAEQILRHMATEYAREDFNLEALVKAVGIGRNKVNEILKNELGYTFTGYLNKLRLTEAARLLAQSSETSISEIAYSVGYKHISYFNKLFKEEYGCSPKMFRSLPHGHDGDEP